MPISIDTSLIAHVAQPAALDDAAEHFADLDRVEAEATIGASSPGRSPAGGRRTQPIGSE